MCRVSVIVWFLWCLMIRLAPNPNLKDQGLSFVWSLPLDQSGMVEPTRDLVSTDIALGVTETRKLHHHSKVTSPGFRQSYVPPI